MKDKLRVKQEEDVAYVLDPTAVESISIPRLYSLSDLPPDLFDHFTANWGNINDERRAKIVRHLADIMELNYTVDFRPLFAFMLQDEYAEVRRAALDGLWDAAHVRLVPAIMKLMLTDNDEGVQVAATKALGHYVLVAQWGEIPPETADPIVKALLVQLEKPDLSPSLYRAALESVASSGHGRVPALIEQAYDSRHEEMRLSAVFAMGISADRRWLNDILHEIESDNPEMRLEAVRAAGTLGASDALDKLIEVVTEEDDLEVQITAVEAIGKIGSEQAQEFLQEMMDEADDDMPDELYEALDEAIEEMVWLGGDISFDMLDIDPDPDEEDELF